MHRVEHSQDSGYSHGLIQATADPRLSPEGPLNLFGQAIPSVSNPNPPNTFHGFSYFVLNLNEQFRPACDHSPSADRSATGVILWKCLSAACECLLATSLVSRGQLGGAAPRWPWAASPDSEGVQLQIEIPLTSTVAPSPQQLLFLHSHISCDSVSAL